MECFRNDNGEWTKGRDRTVESITKHRKDWIQQSKSNVVNRNNLNTVTTGYIPIPIPTSPDFLVFKTQNSSVFDPFLHGQQSTLTMDLSHISLTSLFTVTSR